jgi:hypothetical protein
MTANYRPARANAAARQQCPTARGTPSPPADVGLPDSGERRRVPGLRPNTARLVFLDAHTRDLYVDWPKEAGDVMGKLRLAAGQHPDDPRLAALIGELTMRRGEFAMMWSEHRIRNRDLATYRSSYSGAKDSRIDFAVAAGS